MATPAHPCVCPHVSVRDVYGGFRLRCNLRQPSLGKKCLLNHRFRHPQSVDELRAGDLIFYEAHTHPSADLKHACTPFAQGWALMPQGHPQPTWHERACTCTGTLEHRCTQTHAHRRGTAIRVRSRSTGTSHTSRFGQTAVPFFSGIGLLDLGISMIGMSGTETVL